MKHFLYILLCLLACTRSAYAQQWHFGVEGGYTLNSFHAPTLTLVAHMQTVSLVIKLYYLPVELLIRNSATYLSPLADVVKHFWNKQCYSCTKYLKLVDLAFILLSNPLKSLTFEPVHELN